MPSTLKPSAMAFTRNCTSKEELEAQGGLFRMNVVRKAQLWDFAAGTFIAASILSGMAYIFVTAIH
jgi:hypothetical protein